MLLIALTVIVNIMIRNSSRRFLISVWGTKAIRSAFKEGALLGTLNETGSSTNMSRGCSSPLALIDQAGLTHFLTSRLHSEIRTLLLYLGRGEMLLAVASSYPFQSINHCVHCFSKAQLRCTGRFYDQGLLLPHPRKRSQNLNV
jgi:hypothetical protein